MDLKLKSPLHQANPFNHARLARTVSLFTLEELESPTPSLKQTPELVENHANHISLFS